MGSDYPFLWRIVGGIRLHPRVMGSDMLKCFKDEEDAKVFGLVPFF